VHRCCDDGSTTLQTAVVAAIGVLLLGYVFKAGDWAGLEDKKFWDWLDLLIVPAILGLAGIWLTNRLEEHELAREAHQAKERARDAELQNYFDQMQRLLLHENLRKVEKDSEARAFAEARTKALLQGLDATRKRRLLTFLYASRLIDTPRPVVRLADADLSSAELQGAFLKGADLARVNLRSADLSDAILISANLDQADLDQADLSDANVTQDQLDVAKSLEGATMPNGQKYEDWRKDKAGRGGNEQIPGRS
jgi:hypothetical protein